MVTDTHIYEKAVNAFPFLEQVDRGFQKDLHANGVHVALSAGRFVCMKGNRSGLLPLVLSGSARIFDIGERGREITLYRVEPGESCILTAACILGNKMFPAYAQAETDIEAIGVPDEVARFWMHRHEAWRDFIFDLLSSRLCSVLAVVNEVAFRRMDARIADYLLQATSPRRSSLDVTHEAIASDLGSSREVVSRILKDFERRHLVALSRKQIDVKDFGSLKSISREA